MAEPFATAEFEETQIEASASENSIVAVVAERFITAVVTLRGNINLETEFTDDDGAIFTDDDDIIFTDD